MKHKRFSIRKWRTTALYCLIFFVVGLICGWSVYVVLQPANDPLSSKEQTYASVTVGEIGSSFALNVVADWKPLQVGTNQASGIVTSIDIDPGESVSQGMAIFSVAMEPTAVAKGNIPMYRRMDTTSTGRDVKQLQEMLKDLEFYNGLEDGVYGWETTQAVESWQQSLDATVTGVVELGSLIFLPEMPSRIILDTDVIRKGSIVTGGEAVISSLPSAPEFWLPISEGQLSYINEGDTVLVTSPEGETWEGSVGPRIEGEEFANQVMSIIGIEDMTLCRDSCNQIPITGESLLRAEVITVPYTSGLVVPSASIISTADGTTAVVDEHGQRFPVVIQSSANGMSLITGVEEGLLVRVPASEQDIH